VRAVVDANVLVSALISRVGAPARLVELWVEGDVELVVCRTLLDEVQRTLNRPKISGRVASEDATRFVRLLEELGEVVADPEGPPPVHSDDPGDDYLLALAARERAPLVSGDAHVLALSDKLPISSPRAFLEQLERS
jgi:putative PIN family toxin of toxin-antitoxin system